MGRAKHKAACIGEDRTIYGHRMGIEIHAQVFYKELHKGRFPWK